MTCLRIGRLLSGSSGRLREILVVFFAGSGEFQGRRGDFGYRDDFRRRWRCDGWFLGRFGRRFRGWLRSRIGSLRNEANFRLLPFLLCLYEFRLGLEEGAVRGGLVANEEAEVRGHRVGESQGKETVA